MDDLKIQPIHNNNGKIQYYFTHSIVARQYILISNFAPLVKISKWNPVCATCIELMSQFFHSYFWKKKSRILHGSSGGGIDQYNGFRSIGTISAVRFSIPRLLTEMEAKVWPILYCIWTRNWRRLKANKYIPLLPRGRGEKCPQLYGCLRLTTQRLWHSHCKAWHLLHSTSKCNISNQRGLIDATSSNEKRQCNLLWSYTDSPTAASTGWFAIGLWSTYATMHFLISYSSILN